jgi:hypothetical protein
VAQAIEIAVNGTNQDQSEHVSLFAAAQVALQTAWTGTDAAASAASGVQQAIQIATTGTTQEQTDHAAAMAAAYVALQTAWAGTAAAAAAQSSSGTNSHMKAGFSFVIDGAGAVITSGFKGNVEVPFGMWINQWTLVADQAGSLVVDVTKSNAYAGFPVVASITDADRPTLNNAQKNQNTNPSAWVRQLNEGDIVGFTVVGAGTVQNATIALSGTRS